MQFICASITAKHGTPLSDQEKVTVPLTFDGGIEDLEIARTQGLAALRQYRILRPTEEAYDQGGILTQEDLGRLLHVSSRTIRSDIQALIKDDNTVHTRGYDHDIGRSLSHKIHIIDLFLSGQTYADIMRRTRHSGHNIKRYVLSFGRLLLLKNRGIDELQPLSRLLNQSSRLTEEYLVLFEKYLAGDRWPSCDVDLLEQLQALYPAKKKRRVN